MTIFQQPSGDFKPYTKLSLTSTHTVADSTYDEIDWTQEIRDTHGIHVANEAKVTAPVSGLYLVIGYLSWTASATGRRLCVLRKNGSTQLFNICTSCDGTIPETNRIVRVLELVAGDYIEIQGWQNSGGDLDVLAGQDDSGMQVIYLGST